MHGCYRVERETGPEMRRLSDGMLPLTVRRTAIGHGVITAMVGIGITLATAPTAMSATHRQKVDPFAAGWTVTAKDSGYCQSSSASTKRSDAFRCFYGSY